MIAADTTSYPCLAVIQRQNLDRHPELATMVYECGRKMFEACQRGASFDELRFIGEYNAPSFAAGDALARNYMRAAKKWGWGQ